MSCLVLMYHFVHGKHAKFQGLQGIDGVTFKRQLETLCRERTPLTPKMMLAVARGETSFPDNAFYLTFDDGTVDHYQQVLPVLLDLGLYGDFFPVTEPIVDGVVSVIEKQRVLQYVAFPSYDGFLGAFLGELSAIWNGSEFPGVLDTPAAYDLAVSYRPELDFYSPPERYYRWLRDEIIPPQVYAQTINKMFATAGYDDASFIQSYYMSAGQLRDMQAKGMRIGAHSHTHADLTKMTLDAARAEMDKSRRHLSEILGADPQCMAYPFGFVTPELEKDIVAQGWQYAFATGNTMIADGDSAFRWGRVDATTYFSSNSGQ